MQEFSKIKLKKQVNILEMTGLSSIKGKNESWQAFEKAYLWTSCVELNGTHVDVSSSFQGQ